MIYGVDVHDGYQTGLDFSLLVRQGYSFAVVKLTEGTSYARGAGPAWVRVARADGLVPGAYHWLKRGAGADQAAWFLSRVRDAGGPDGMLIQLDCEDDATWQDVQDWHDAWTHLSGGHPYLLYTGTWWWAPRLAFGDPGWPGETLTPYLWHSHYLHADLDAVPDDPATFAAQIPGDWWTPGYGGWPAATILQFTSKGDAGGLANNVDLNIFRGTREQLLMLTRTPTTTQKGADMGIAEDDYVWCEGSLYRLVGLDAHPVGDDAGLKRVYAHRGVPYSVQGDGEIQVTRGELEGGWRVAAPAAAADPAAPHVHGIVASGTTGPAQPPA